MNFFFEKAGWVSLIPTVGVSKKAAFCGESEWQIGVIVGPFVAGVTWTS